MEKRRVFSSTHTFILYLTDCQNGGETALLRSMKTNILKSPGSLSPLTGPSENIIALVAPRKGRMLIFPHAAPHSGLTIHSVPKLLLRGEAYIPTPNSAFKL